MYYGHNACRASLLSTAVLAVKVWPPSDFTDVLPPPGSAQEDQLFEALQARAEALRDVDVKVARDKCAPAHALDACGLLVEHALSCNVCGGVLRCDMYVRTLPCSRSGAGQCPHIFLSSNLNLSISISISISISSGLTSC